MKGRKFKLLGHIGLVLFLVSALMLAVMPVAQAATAVTNVWVEFEDTADMNTVGVATNQYLIHFKPTTALKRGVDTVTVTFPDGTSTMGGTGSTYKFSTGALSSSEVDFSTNYGSKVVGGATWTDCTDIGGSAPDYGGTRVRVTPPIDLAAGSDVWVRFASDNITAASAVGSSYKVYVSTSKDTTPVLSEPFALGHATNVVSSVSATVSPATAGAAAQYIFTFTTSAEGALTASSGKVAVRFPVGTTVPSSIDASNVYVKDEDASDYTACGVAPTCYPNRRIVILTTPTDLSASQTHNIKIVSAAGITNPTIAEASGSDGGDYYVGLRTSAEREWVPCAAGDIYAITAGSGTQVVIANGETGKASDLYSDDATMINMYSSQIYVFLADQYGNGITPASAVTVTPSSSSGTGAFYKAASGTSGSGVAMSSINTITVNATDGYNPDQNAQIVYYKDTAAGTHTLTFAADNYTNTEWTITVLPAVSVYDSGNNLVNTYAPTTSSLASETGSTSADESNNYSCEYVNDAISGAIAGDTVKVGDGIVEVDTNYINLNKKITLTSVNGASSTTIRPATIDTEIDYAIKIGISGTATYPVVIDGFTFTWRRATIDMDCAVYNDSYNYMTVRNCIFNRVNPDQGSSFEAVVWVRTTGSAITSATVSDNTFTNCVGFNAISGARSGCIVFDGANSSANITGVTVSGNTITDCNDYGIAIGGCGDCSVSGEFTNNTITNGFGPICLADYVGSSGFKVTGNTITNAYCYAIRVEGSHNGGSIVIKNNTITDTAATYTNTYAIRVWDHSTETDSTPDYTHYIQYNDITGTNGYAFYIDSTVGSNYPYIDCRYNYYGDASGPYYSALTGASVTKSNPNGTGDKISDRVYYYPWLHKSVADVVADNASYQTSTMKLVLGGWNTLSTPVKLISAADAVDELISTDDMEIGYYYDGGWQQITTGYVLNACDAVYVKMKSTASTAYVQFKFDAGAFSTPSKDLAAGWNLISLASLASSGMKDAPAVASVYSTAANLPGYSQVVSPSINATQKDMYGNTGTSWAYSRDETTGTGTNYMYAGLGYWIYMQNAATLAGFEITPIAPDLD